MLPAGQRIVLLVTAPNGRGGGLLQLEVEPAPANDPKIVKALATVGYGGEPGAPAPPRTAAEPETPRETAAPAAAEPPTPTSPVLPASQARLRAPTGPSRPVQPDDEPPMPRAEIELPPTTPPLQTAKNKETLPGSGLPVMEPPQPAAEQPVPETKAAPASDAPKKRRRRRPAAAIRPTTSGAWFGRGRFPMLGVQEHPGSLRRTFQGSWT